MSQNVSLGAVDSPQPKALSTCKALVLRAVILPTRATDPSPPLLLFVGGLALGATIVALLAATVFMQAPARADRSVASARPSIVAHDVVAGLTTVHARNVPIAPSLISAARESLPARRPTRYPSQSTPSEVQLMHYIIQEQNKVITALTGTQTAPSTLPGTQALDVPPDIPTVNRESRPIPRPTVAAHPTPVEPHPASPRFEAPPPAMNHGPWPGWDLFGMSGNAIMLTDARGDVRLIHRGESFLGVRLLAVNPGANTARTSAGPIKGTSHR